MVDTGYELLFLFGGRAAGARAALRSVAAVLFDWSVLLLVVMLPGVLSLTQVVLQGVLQGVLKGMLLYLQGAWHPCAW